MYFGFRTLIVATICGVAFLIPNINILLTFGGAILGTIVNILLPVLFFNRAYSWTPKNRALENDMERIDAKREIKEEESDPRLWTKVFSWIILFFGIVIGLVGLVYVIMELSSGNAKHDSA